MFKLFRSKQTRETKAILERIAQLETTLLEAIAGGDLQKVKDKIDQNKAALTAAMTSATPKGK